MLNGKRHGGVKGVGMGVSKSSLITPLSSRLFQLIATPRAVLLPFYRRRSAGRSPAASSSGTSRVHREIQGNDETA